MGKASERMQQGVEKVTFNWSISQAMQPTMQDLSELQVGHTVWTSGWPYW